MRLSDVPQDIRTTTSRKLDMLVNVLKAKNPYWHHKRAIQYHYLDSIVNKESSIGEVVVSEHWALHLEDR